MPELHPPRPVSSRRPVHVAAAVLALALIATVPLTTCSKPVRPNVLIVVVDTCRGDRCGFNGYARSTTPSLDAFRTDAVTFTEAWSPGAWTGPGHASLFTGLRPESHGLMETVRTYLDEQSETLAERLALAGYATAAFSNNPIVSPKLGLIQGFEHFDPVYEDVGDALPTSKITHERVMSWIDEHTHRGEPFFVFVNHMEPHLPYKPVPRARTDVLEGGVPPQVYERALKFGAPLSVVNALGPSLVDEPMRAALSRMYDEQIETVDAEIGALLDGFRARGLLDDTIVVLTSDHGENLGEHGLYDHRMSLHRTVLHVPLIVRYPGVFDGGRTESALVRLEDVTPTVYELTGVAGPGGMEGVTLTRDLEGRIARGIHGNLLRAEESLRHQFPSIDTRRLQLSYRSTCDGRYHLIRYSDDRDELFDLETDPDELHDISATAPDILERLRRLDDDR